MSTKMAVSITSNGDTFVGPKGRDRLAILARGGVSVLNLSLHDLRETDRQLDSLVFAKTLGVIPILATVVTKATIGRLPDIMVEANRRGILFRYMLYQSVGGSFSSQVDGLSPTQEEISAFISIVGQQRRKTHLVQNTRRDIAEATDAYPRNWHCDSYKDHWVVVDNEGRLMACAEHPTDVSVLDIPSLTDPSWTDTRTAKREACAGCSYQCYMDEEGLHRADMIREGITTGLGLLRAGIHTKPYQEAEKRSLADSANINRAKSM
jgi:MoaA/NifB/PqqE/SkfB family radical SAM enzyme